jgi:hypothetical protein
MDKFFLVMRIGTVLIFILNGIGLLIAGQKNQGAISFTFALANYLVFFGK